MTDAELSEEHINQFARLLHDALFFNVFSLDELRSLVREAQLLRWKRFERGAQIFEEGAAGHHFYIVIQGKIQIMKAAGGRATHVASIGRGGVFGELVICSPEKPRRAAAFVSHEAEAVLCEIDGALLASVTPRLRAKFLKKFLDLILDRFLVASRRNPYYEDIIAYAAKQGDDACRELLGYSLATAVSDRNRVTQLIKYTDFLVAQKLDPAGAVALLEQLIAAAVLDLEESFKES